MSVILTCIEEVVSPIDESDFPLKPPLLPLLNVPPDSTFTKTISGLFTLFMLFILMVKFPPFFTIKLPPFFRLMFPPEVETFCPETSILKYGYSAPDLIDWLVEDDPPANSIIPPVKLKAPFMIGIVPDPVNPRVPILNRPPSIVKVVELIALLGPMLFDVASTIVVAPVIFSEPLTSRYIVLPGVLVPPSDKIRL